MSDWLNVWMLTLSVHFNPTFLTCCLHLSSSTSSSSASFSSSSSSSVLARFLQLDHVQHAAIHRSNAGRTETSPELLRCFFSTIVGAKQMTPEPFKKMKLQRCFKATSYPRDFQDKTLQMCASVFLLFSFIYCNLLSKSNQDMQTACRYSSEQCVGVEGSLVV